MHTSYSVHEVHSPLFVQCTESRCVYQSYFDFFSLDLQFRYAVLLEISLYVYNLVLFPIVLNLSPFLFWYVRAHFGLKFG